MHTSQRNKFLKFNLTYFVAISVVIELLFLCSAKGSSFSKTREHQFLTSDSINRISQNNLPPYFCSISSEQTNLTPPTVNWRSSASCARGIPTRLSTDVYYANVNFPYTYYYVGSNTFNCGVSSFCASPSYGRTIDRTQLFFITTQLTVKGTDGKTYTEPNRTQTTRPFNDRGVMYPQIKPTRLDMDLVPFYGPPYAVIAIRNTTFSSDLRNFYNSQNWTIPSDTPEGHHIKPLSWGGDNNYIQNGVFLGSTTHSLFTNWWLQFSNLNW
jgi:hypothetical protein